MTPLPLPFLVVLLASWLCRHQQEAIEYLQEENRILREHVGGKRLRFTDAQRRRLGRKAKRLGRSRLREISTLVTPDTLLRWYRERVSAKYDGSSMRRPGRPRIEVVTWRGLVRYFVLFVLFVIDLKSLRVEIAGITATPNGEWMQQVARNLVDCEEGFLVNSRHLIHDRDPLFTHAFAATLKRARVHPRHGSPEATLP